MTYDFILIGGGIVGASTAWQLQCRYPGKRILLLEREAEFASHQTGRNSGVIHAGVYYSPGSLKAQFCKEGAAATAEFCEKYALPWQRCGKLLVATTPLEMERMRALFERCGRNGIEVRWLGAEALREREPDIDGLGAIDVPATGMADYAAVCRQLLALFREAGGETRAQSEVLGIAERGDAITVRTARAEFTGAYLVACAGIMADRLARLQGLDVGFRMVPFRGEYYRLKASCPVRIEQHIYPIPDPALPFLGIHLTRTVDGGITIGPNAVLAAGRYAYGRGDRNWRDIEEMLVFPGFWRLAPRYWRQGLAEWRNSRWPAQYLREAQKYCPRLRLEDLAPHPSGIRAQAVARDGQLAQDFLFVESARSLHVCNAPSPAATSALPIGLHIVRRIAARLSGE